jgi:hypothetical protein
VVIYHHRSCAREAVGAPFVLFVLFGIAMCSCGIASMLETVHSFRRGEKKTRSPRLTDLSTSTHSKRNRSGVSFVRTNILASTPYTPPHPNGILYVHSYFIPFRFLSISDTHITFAKLLLSYTIHEQRSSLNHSQHKQQYHARRSPVYVLARLGPSALNVFSLIGHLANWAHIQKQWHSLPSRQA